MYVHFVVEVDLTTEEFTKLHTNMREYIKRKGFAYRGTFKTEEQPPRKFDSKLMRSALLKNKSLFDY